MDRRTFGKLATAFTLAAPADLRAAAQASSATAPNEAPAPAEPLHIGNRKQLFLDRWIVADADEVAFTVVPPTRHGDTPVMMADPPADEHAPYAQATNPVGVHWNQQKKLFEMWYEAVYLAPGKERHYLAYADSPDGIAWRKPQLGLKKVDGFHEGNFIDGPGGRILFDEHETDPQRRLKMAAGGVNLRLWFSPDGMHWTPATKDPIFTKIGDTHTLLGWDPKRQKYVGYFRPRNPPGPVPRRTVGISLSDDCVTWTPLQEILAPDEHDPVGTEFYYLSPIQVGDMYIGLLTVLHIDRQFLDFRQTDPEGPEQTADVQLVSSRDGIHWTRMANRQPWLRLGDFESWDDQNLWPVTPITHDGRVLIYYGGQPVRHTIPKLQNEFGKKIDGRTRVGGVGLVTLREDGWVAARPNLGRRATLTTRTITLEHPNLYINADASQGKCTIELLSADNKPLPQFSGANAIVLSSDSLRHHASFKHSLAQLKGQPIRLRFTLEHAKLYSFQFDV
ncbi:MAG: hypothetical protein V4555_08205 [Acidobacteriota bacterium]